MNYYVETNFYDHDGLVTSGGKGRDDYFEMMRRCGLKRIVIPTVKSAREVKAQDRLRLDRKLTREWRAALRALGSGDVLFIHQPPSEKFLNFLTVLEEVRNRGCRIVTVVFDLESYLTPYYSSFGMLKYGASRLMEVSVLKMSDCIIVHNDKMKEQVVSMGIDPGIIFSVGIMDYLRDEAPDADSIRQRTGRQLPVVFCGNLIREKAGFLEDIPEDLTLDLYGPGYKGNGSGNISYRGVVPSVKIMDVISGSFGLVWDGESAETPAGTTGEYLRINNPHKIAMYLASGLPVIVWDESAMADFVRREECGFMVSSLREIPERIAKISDEEYARMRDNAMRVGAEMRKGSHIRAAVEKALCKVQAVNSRKALIIFTREPEPGKTKTRLMPYLSAEKCAGLHRCMLKDIRDEMKSADADIIVAYTGGQNGPEFLRRTFGGKTVFIEQRGSGIGERMQNAVADVLGLGYDRAVLIGTDIPDLEADTVDTAFAMLDFSDVVMGPTEDGGYYLIGMKEVRPEAFSVKLYGVDTVFNETVAALHGAGISVSCVDEYSDIDVPEDAAEFRRRMREDAGLRKSRTGQFLSENASVSVIVPVYNESARIGRLLTQLLPYRNECEIIIADGGSTDDTVHKAEELIAECSGGAECNVKILKNKKGRGIQMNAGALASTGDILLFLHCDSVLPEGFLREIRRTMSENDWGCFGVRFDSHNLFMITNRIMSNFRARVGRQPFGDQGIFIDREIFFEAGMFPEIPVMEDYEFSLRMKRYGFRPGMTARRITTSARRYIKPGCGLIEETRDILKTEMDMWKLRFMYRMGKSPEEIEKMYKDIR